MLIQYLNVMKSREKTERMETSFKINHDLRNYAYSLTNLIIQLLKSSNSTGKENIKKVEIDIVYENEILLTNSEDYDEMLHSIKIIK